MLSTSKHFNLSKVIDVTGAGIPNDNLTNDNLTNDNLTNDNLLSINGQ